jgi:hypothetical protein
MSGIEQFSNPLVVVTGVVLAATAALLAALRRWRQARLTARERAARGAGRTA